PEYRGESSPGQTLRISTSFDFNTSHRSMVDDEMYFMQGRDGAHTGDPQVPGEPHRFARADMAYLEYPNGGAVFSAGSICWRGSLSANDYGGTVSRGTENGLRRFAGPAGRRSGEGRASRSRIRRRSGRPTPTIRPATRANRGSRGWPRARSSSATA